MKNPRRTRRVLVFAAIGLGVVAAFFAGRYWEHFKNGPWYEVHDDRTYNSQFGTIHLRHVTDTKGWPFLDTGDSVITLEGRAGPDVTLYQSKRVFQESWPWVYRVQIEGDQLRWSDGAYRYTLRLERVGPTTQPQ
jgi:hypothetical protein